MMELKNNKLSLVGFWLGIASIFLSFIGIIPLVGMVVCVVGMIQFDRTIHKNI